MVMENSASKPDNAEIDESSDEYLDRDSNSSESSSEWHLSESANPKSPKKNRLYSRSDSLFEIDGDWSKAIFKSGLYAFLKTNAGGNNSNQNARNTCRRLASFISWVLKSKDSCYSPTNPLLTIMELLVRTPQNLGKYVDFLSHRKASPSTKLTVLCQLKKCSLWARLYCPVGISYDQSCFDKVCGNIYRVCSKQNRLRIQDRGNLDNLISDKRWPEGGYAELREHVLKGGCDFMDRLLFSVSNGEALKSSDYCRLIRVLVTLMYLTSHQGRPNALDQLRLIIDYTY